MTNLLEKISDLNDLILQGKILDAFEKYYHEDITMQENEHPPVVGKKQNREREKAFVDAIVEFRSAKPLKVTIGENTTMVEWHLDYSHKELGERNYNQVAVQEWKDGKIVNEKFYYNN
ncbi:SnoaL-like domain-containing protein [Tenacibaculum amylolyticum]|uniref:SnoaL-like domain-containing protein n=1 Tax=Tenacibaculum amylolyticum TaxID=104269 RepID=UPI0038955E2D